MEGRCQWGQEAGIYKGDCKVARRRVYHFLVEVTKRTMGPSEVRATSGAT